MKVFDAEMLDNLSRQASASQRLRQHKNIHSTYQEPCQRLFNAIEPGSYIRPHKHAKDRRHELLIAIRGLMTLVTFDDEGAITNTIRFGSEAHGNDLDVGIEIPPETWHTVVALVPGCVLLEVKAGPFDPHQSKDLAPWAADEASEEAPNYLRWLMSTCRSRL